MNAIYIPEDDVYSISYRGFAIQNFTTPIFYELPKRMRERMLLPLLKKGLTHNIGEKSVKDTLITKTQYGQRIA
jgi:hypothetical protein